jgi:hypothetical protein
VGVAVDMLVLTVVNSITRESNIIKSITREINIINSITRESNIIVFKIIFIEDFSCSAEMYFLILIKAIKSEGIFSEFDQGNEN